MPGILGRRRKTRARRATPPAAERLTPIVVVGDAFNAATLILGFNQPVTLKGVPRYPDQDGAPPVAATLTAPDTLALTYAAPPTSVTIPYQDPAVRNAAGGYVTPRRFDN